MNETWTGLAADGNLESVDVAASWMGVRDLERARAEETYFSDLWSNRYPTLTVRPFPDVAREELVDAADPDWEATSERLTLEPDSASRRQRGFPWPHPSPTPSGRPGVMDRERAAGNPGVRDRKR